MKLIIVESPNKVKTISGFLDKSYTVTASVGHIRHIKDTGLYNMGIDPSNDFKIHFEIDDDKVEVVQKIKALAKQADEIYLASDEDREGEAIAWHLKKVLGLKDGQYKRVTFNEITKKEVIKGLAAPRDIDRNLVNAALTRSIVDKIVGYRVSGPVMQNTGGRSAGRVQSAALKILCDKENEIRAFVPHTYYELDLLFQKNGSQYKAVFAGKNDAKVGEITDKKYVDNIISECAGKDFAVADIRSKERTIAAKVPFTTSTYLQECSSKIGLSPKRATECAQKLFEGINVNGTHTGLITYIRTDSTRIDNDFKELLYKHVESNYGKNYVGEVKESKSKSKEQGAHEAIRIVDISLTPASISPFIQDADMIKAYRLIYDRTIAAAMSDCTMDDETVVIRNGDNRFETTGHLIKFDGWKKVYSYKDNSDDEESFPTMAIGDKLAKTSLSIATKETKPPKRYSETSLIKAMEDDGIGRPSTYSSTITVLKDPGRGYTKSENGSLIPTELGLTVSKFLDEHFGDIINLNYTAELETKLDGIAAGETDSIVMLKDFYDKLEEEINKVNKFHRASEKTDKICPKCGHPLVKRMSKHGAFLGCSNYPKCKYTENIDGTPTYTASTPSTNPDGTPIIKHEPMITDKHCPICNGLLVKHFNKHDGRPFYGCSNYPKCHYVIGQADFDKLGK